VRRRRQSDGVFILGPTGSGRAILENFRANGREVDCFVDPQGKFRGDSWAGLPVVKLDGEEELPELRRLGLEEFAIVSGAPASRRRLLLACAAAGLRPVTLVHPTAVVMADARLGEGCVIGARALVGPATVLEENCLVGMGSIVDHTCALAAHVIVGAGVRVGHEGRIEEGAFLGDGVTTLPGRRIGAGAVIVSGSVITQDVPADSVAAGVPARLIRRKRTVVGTEQ